MTILASSDKPPLLLLFGFVTVYLISSEPEKFGPGVYVAFHWTNWEVDSSEKDILLSVPNSGCCVIVKDSVPSKGNSKNTSNPTNAISLSPSSGISSSSANDSGGLNLDHLPLFKLKTPKANLDDSSPSEAL